MQGVYDMDKRFWNVCASQPSGLHDDGNLSINQGVKAWSNR
jgi:hypothetical protein